MLSIRDIQRATADAYGITLDEMLSSTRERRIARPRQVAMYLAHYHCARSLGTIGRLFRRDHSTVLYGVRAVRADEDRLLQAASVRRSIINQIPAQPENQTGHAAVKTA